MSKRNYAQMVGDAVRTGVKLYGAYNNMRQSLRRSSKGAAPEVGGTHTVSRRYMRSGRVRRRTAKHVFKNLLGSGSELIIRWQRSSQTYIGPGSVPLCWGGASSTAVQHFTPINFMSLSALGYVQPGGSYSLQKEKGCRVNGMFGIDYDPTAGAEQYSFGVVPCQTNTGAVDLTGQWQLESYDRNLGDLTDSTRLSGVFHKYTDIRLNLYGCYDVPIRYHVQLIQPKEDYDFLCAAGGIDRVGSRSDIGQMLTDWVKPLLYNSVNTNPNKDWRRGVKVLKSANVTIQPLSFSDQRAERLDASEGQTVGHTGGHIHELRWFVRHDRFRKYDWDHVPYQDSVNGNVGTWDQNVNNGLYCDVEPGRKVYLVITASAAAFDASATNAKISGSYDACIRQSYVLFQ